MKIRRDWSPEKNEFGRFGASKFSERLEPSIRRDCSTPGTHICSLLLLLILLKVGSVFLCSFKSACVWLDTGHGAAAWCPKFSAFGTYQGSGDLVSIRNYFAVYTSDPYLLVISGIFQNFSFLKKGRKKTFNMSNFFGFYLACCRSRT